MGASDYAQNSIFWTFPLARFVASVRRARATAPGPSKGSGWRICPPPACRAGAVSGTFVLGMATKNLTDFQTQVPQLAHSQTDIHRCRKADWREIQRRHASTTSLHHHEQLVLQLRQPQHSISTAGECISWSAWVAQRPRLRSRLSTARRLWCKRTERAAALVRPS